MDWTAPRTWVPGEIPSAATLNTHIRDNLTQLRTPHSGRGARTASNQSIAHSSSTTIVTYPSTSGTPGVAVDGLFYPTVTGLYLVTGSFQTESAAYTSVTLNFRTTGGVRECVSDLTTVTGRRRLAAAEVLSLTAGDWVGMTCTQVNDSSAARNIDYARFSVTWIGAA